MEIESKQPFDQAQGRQILERRKEIEREIVDMLKETDPTSPPPSRKDSEGRGMLRRGKERFYPRIGITPVAEQVRNGAGFLHEVLGGISPAEVLLNHKNKNI